MLVVTAWSLRHRDTTDTLRRLCGRSRWRTFAPRDGLDAVRRAARIVPAKCLAQAVALTVALARTGEDPTLVLGCRRYDEGEWGAHAWVLADGSVLDPIPSGEHTPLAHLGAGTGWTPVPVVGT